MLTLDKINTKIKELEEKLRILHSMKSGYTVFPELFDESNKPPKKTLNLLSKQKVTSLGQSLIDAARKLDDGFTYKELYAELVNNGYEDIPLETVRQYLWRTSHGESPIFERTFAGAGQRPSKFKLIDK